MLRKANCKYNIKIKKQNNSSYEKISTKDKEVIKVYNYWDLKLYEYYEKNLKQRRNLDGLGTLYKVIGMGVKGDGLGHRFIMQPKKEKASKGLDE